MRITLMINMLKMQRYGEKCYKKSISFDDYRNTLLHSSQIEHTSKRNGTRNHNIQSFEIIKVSLSCFDNKRYIFEDGKTTLAYTHKNIPGGS